MDLISWKLNVIVYKVKKDILIIYQNKQNIMNCLHEHHKIFQVILKDNIYIGDRN